MKSLVYLTRDAFAAVYRKQTTQAKTMSDTRRKPSARKPRKLPDDRIREIRDLREKTGMSYGQMARHLSLPESLVFDVCTRRRTYEGT